MELCNTTNPDSLFHKYGNLVTWFANTQLGRDYLSIPNSLSYIGKLTANSYHEILERSNKITARATLYSSDRYYKKLGLALQTIDDIQGYIGNFNQAKEALAHYLGLRQSFLFPSVMYDTTNFFSSASGVSGAVGREAVDQTWANIIAGAGNATDVAAGANHYMQSSGTSNQWAYLRRVITMFNTASLTSAATITAGSNTWGLYISAVPSNFFTQTIRMVQSTPASTTGLANADYGQVGSTAQSNTDLALASMTTSQYNNLTLNTTGDGNISKTGVTKFGARFVSDITGTPPTWSGGQTTYYTFSTEAGANPPKLVVTYTLPATGGGSFFLNFV